jgi:hypothetical protein
MATMMFALLLAMLAVVSATENTNTSTACDPSPCTSGQECVLNPIECFTTPCPQYLCVECVLCVAVVPECVTQGVQGCPAGQTCQIDPGNCTSCASAACVDDQLICPAVMPTCGDGCLSGQICLVHPQNATNCASAVCAEKSDHPGCLCEDGQECVPAPVECGAYPCIQYVCLDCVMCPAVMPECMTEGVSGCPAGETCHMDARNCTSCASATCVRLPSSSTSTSSTDEKRTEAVTVAVSVVGAVVLVALVAVVALVIRNRKLAAQSAKSLIPSTTQL